MKKILLILVSLFLCIGLVGCSSNTNKDNNGDVQVDKGLLNVTITLSNGYLSQIAETTAEDYVNSLDDETKAKFKDVKTNDDGSVSITMSRSDYETLLNEIKTQIDEGLKSIVDDNENYPNITNVETNSDYTKFTIQLANNEIGLMDGFMVIAFYVYGYSYQTYLENPNYSIEIIYKGNDGTILSDETYDESFLKEAFSDLSSD